MMTETAVKHVGNEWRVIKSLHIIAFVDLIVYNELPGCFAKDTTITAAEVTSGCQGLIRYGVAL
jgi:hypothetical protein